MSIVPDSSLELIEHLDWEHTPQCEHSEHGTDWRVHSGPAAVLVNRVPCSCKGPRQMYLCAGFWTWAQREGHYVHCELCGYERPACDVYIPLGWVE